MLLLLNDWTIFGKASKKKIEQVEAEVVPSSSLVEVEVEFGVEVEVKVRAQNYFFGVSGWWVGFWESTKSP